MTTQPQATSSQANAGDASRGATLRVSLVQADLRWEDPAENCRLLGEQLDAAGLVMGAAGRNAETDLIVLPEMFATGFTMNSREMAEPMAQSSTVAWLRSITGVPGGIVTLLSGPTSAIR